MRPLSETLKAKIEGGIPLSPFAVAQLRKAGQEQALKANAQNVIRAMLEGTRITEEQFEEARRYFPERAQEFLDAGGKIVEDKNARQTCSAIARRLAIAQPTLYKLLRAHDDAPQPDAAGKYDAKEVTAWYLSHKVARAKPASLKEQALAEDVRIKRAKADMAEGKAIPRDEVEELFLRIYNLCWATLLTNAKRYGSDEKEAIENARADFAELRQKLQEFSSVDQ